MKTVVQRVRSAAVSVEGGRTTGIGHGLAVLLGIHRDDTEDDARWMADRMLGLRIFDDDEGNMNRALADVQGELLVVSQVTLCADVTGGRRPSFLAAARPEKGRALYERFVSFCREAGVVTVTGVFGARMVVELTNDGPVTIVLESRER